MKAKKTNFFRPFLFCDEPNFYGHQPVQVKPLAKILRSGFDFRDVSKNQKNLFSVPVVKKKTGRPAGLFQKQPRLNYDMVARR